MFLPANDARKHAVPAPQVYGWRVVAMEFQI
jgi:hypothetical protein